MKILPVGAELFRADGQADGQTSWQIRREEAKSRLSQFCEGAPPQKKQGSTLGSFVGYSQYTANLFIYVYILLYVTWTTCFDLSIF